VFQRPGRCAIRFPDLGESSSSIRGTMKFTAILLAMMRPGRLSGYVLGRRFFLFVDGGRISSTWYMGPARDLFLLVALRRNAAKRKGQESGDQPGPNNRASRAT
jgi:hypothetical protein